MCDIVCKYKDKCTRHPSWCESCVNNEGKRDYYYPKPIPENPWYPWSPWYPYYPYYWQTTISVYSDDTKTDFFTACGEK